MKKKSSNLAIIGIIALNAIAAIGSITKRARAYGNFLHIQQQNLRIARTRREEKKCLWRYLSILAARVYVALPPNTIITHRKN